MGADNFLNQSVAGKRTARRSRVLLAASLETPAGTSPARLRDLSEKGALIECESQPEVGSEVVFVRGSNRIPARTAWVAAGRIGLEFHDPIDEHDVLVQLKHEPPNDVNQRYRRPALGQVMTAKDLRLAKAWGVAVGLDVPESLG